MNITKSFVSLVSPCLWPHVWGEKYLRPLWKKPGGEIIIYQLLFCVCVCACEKNKFNNKITNI